jgi:hypothetical protein
MGHTKVGYPLLQNKNKNHHYKRTMKATWSYDMDSS